MSDQIDAVDAADDILEGAAEVAEGVVQMARGFSGLALSGAFVVGAGLGGALGYIFAQRKLQTKYRELAEEEIAGMRQHYADKAVALENSVEKPKLEEIVREQGYSTDAAPPMAVEPPSAVVDRAQEVAEAEEDGKPETAVTEPSEPEVRNVFRDAKVEDEWDHHKERAQRSPLRPFVIHRDEREEQETYDEQTLTYYEEDDVLCDEGDDIISGPDRERIVGEENLEKFGHGSGDANIVYIRNPKLETDIELIRSPNSYAEEVAGFTPEPEDELRHSHSRGRARFDDEE